MIIEVTEDDYHNGNSYDDLWWFMMIYDDLEVTEDDLWGNWGWFMR